MFKVIDAVTNTIVGYGGLKELELFVNCVDDSLCDSEGVRMFCCALDEESTDKKNKSDAPKIHAQLTRDHPGQKIRKASDRLLLPFGKSMVLGPFQTKKTI